MTIFIVRGESRRIEFEGPKRDCELYVRTGQIIADGKVYSVEEAN
jgi:hypothetical protein